jgi:hypothetical protein
MSMTVERKLARPRKKDVNAKGGGQSKVQWGDIILWGTYLARLEIARYVPSISSYLMYPGVRLTLSSQHHPKPGVGSNKFYGPLY